MCMPIFHLRSSLRILETSHLFSSTLLLCCYGHAAAVRILILTNCYEMTNLLLRKFTFTEHQTIYENFILQKLGAIQFVCV